MKLWGGNYASEPDREFWEFNRSFGFDVRLLPEEIAASRAWLRALGRCGAVGADEAARLDAALAAILERAAQDPGFLDVDAEDVHSFVETRLAEAVGESAGQVHLGRSRNEQAVTALRMFLRSALDTLRSGCAALVHALVEQGRAGADAVMPGYTHVRPAEPVTFGHLMAAHAWALVRDRDRLADARVRIDVLPLGSGALAGSALPLDRDALARDLGFARVSENALDAVTDRDFVAETAFACAQIQVHLARLAEDLARFAAPELGFVGLPEAYTTGSSLMPHKKNPDALELVRGKAGRVVAGVVRVLVLMKGLPTGYQKDLQEDKEAVFDVVDTTRVSLGVMRGVVAGLDQRRGPMRAAAALPELMAASLAVALARDGLPFRTAHERVGSLVARAEREGRPLPEVAAAELAGTAPAVAARLGELFDPDQAVRSRALPGGTAPDAVLASLEAALARVGKPEPPGSDRARRS